MRSRFLEWQLLKISGVSKENIVRNGSVLFLEFLDNLSKVGLEHFAFGTSPSNEDSAVSISWIFWISESECSRLLICTRKVNSRRCIFMDFREKTRKDRKTVYIFKVLDSLISKQNLKLTKINWYDNLKIKK